MSINRWMDKEDVVYIYIYIYMNIGHKKEWHITICSNMDGLRDYHTEWNKSDRERQILYDITFMWNFKKMIQMNLFTKQKPCHKLQKKLTGASLVAQWLGICLPMQGTRVWALVWEDPTCRGATRPVSHNCWACASGACDPQQERPRQWEARAPRWRVAPACRN